MIYNIYNYLRNIITRKWAVTFGRDNILDNMWPGISIGRITGILDEQ